MKAYTGVGSRQTPKYVMDVMTRLARKLDQLGFVLRSGGAAGADLAFEKGATTKEIYTARDCTLEAMAIAEEFHPAWHRCGLFARKLHGRNAFQVLGKSLNSPSRFVVCYTKDGVVSHDRRTIKTGGTGTAISIADAWQIPVFNLGRKDHWKRIYEFVNRKEG
ncbi:MAG: hypothetical protein ACWGQW_14930 [bacterium]